MVLIHPKLEFVDFEDINLGMNLLNIHQNYQNTFTDWYIASLGHLDEGFGTITLPRAGNSLVEP